jgi:hypothetical protein
MKGEDYNCTPSRYNSMGENPVSRSLIFTGLFVCLKGQSFVTKKEDRVQSFVVALISLSTGKRSMQSNVFGWLRIFLKKEGNLSLTPES